MPDSAETDGGPDLDAAADELYALHPDEFVARRGELVAAARAAKDRESATAIGALRKPSHAAWLANLLAREQPDEVGALGELGAAVRAAQDRLSGEALRETQRRRRALVGALVTRARALARERGASVAPGTERELERTVAASLADATIAGAFARGRLVTALEPGATLGAPGTAGLEDGASTAATPRRTGGRAAARSASRGGAVERERLPPERVERERAERERVERERAERERAERERAERERAERDRAVAEARTALDEAERSASGTRSALHDAREAESAATAAVDDLEARLERARQEARTAADAVVARRRDHDRAATVADLAQRTLEQAQAHRAELDAGSEP